MIEILKLCWTNDNADLERAGRLLDEIKPALILVGEDGLGGPLHLIGVARDRRVPVVVVPYEYSTRVQIMRHINDYGRETHRLGNDLVSRAMVRLMPHWIAEGSDGPVTRLPPALAVSLRFHGMAPHQPWTVHGGMADRIAVESTAMLAHYRREGISERKLAFTGALANDELHAVIRSDPARALSFDNATKRVSGRTSILCALPPSYLPERAKQSEFATFAELATFWIDTLTSLPDVDVTFQLHPAVGLADAEMIRRRAAVSEENIVELIPRSDILVTTVSSIIRYAIACRKPVVNYDVYRFENPDYVDAPGVLNIDTAKAFREGLSRLVSEDSYYSQLASAQLQEGHHWGLLDGKAGGRFVALVDKLAR